MEIMYQFDPGYVDLCHPNNPNCVSGVTCPDCNSSYNPNIVVDGELIVYSNTIFTSIDDVPLQTLNIDISPNPTDGLVKITSNSKVLTDASYSVHTIMGQVILDGTWDGREQIVDLSNQPKGIYIVKVKTADGTRAKKLIMQ